MKHKRSLTLLVGMGLVVLLVTPSLAQVIKLTLTDQNPTTSAMLKRSY